jgi:hypothetical protein
MFYIDPKEILWEECLILFTFIFILIGATHKLYPQGMQGMRSHG